MSAAFFSLKNLSYTDYTGKKAMRKPSGDTDTVN